MKCQIFNWYVLVCQLWRMTKQLGAVDWDSPDVILGPEKKKKLEEF